MWLSNGATPWPHVVVNIAKEKTMNTKTRKTNRTAGTDRPISMRRAMEIARTMGIRGVEVRRSTVDPACWDVSDAHRLHGYGPMTEAAWRKVMSEWKS